MRTNYTGMYRTCLTEEEKRDFKKLALKEGSVAEIHDRLIREYIKARKEKEKQS